MDNKEGSKKDTKYKVLNLYVDCGNLYVNDQSTDALLCFAGIEASAMVQPKEFSSHTMSLLLQFLYRGSLEQVRPAFGQLLGMVLWRSWYCRTLWVKTRE